MRSTPSNGRIAVGWLIVEDLAMVLALVLLPALAESLGGGATRLRGAGRRRAARGWRSRSRSARSRCSSRWCCWSGRAWCRGCSSGRAHRLARAVHACGAGGRARHRLRLGRAVRRVVRARRILRGRGPQRVGPQPSGGRRFAAAAGRVRGALLRVGRHAVRSRRSWCASRSRCWPSLLVIVVGKSLAAFASCSPSAIRSRRR